MNDALVVKAAAYSTYLLASGLFLQLLQSLGEYSQGLGVLLALGTFLVNWWYKSPKKEETEHEKMARFYASANTDRVRHGKRKRRNRLSRD